MKWVKSNSAAIYLANVNNRTTRAMCEICSKLTIRTPERRYSGIFIVNFEQANAGWELLFECFYIGNKNKGFANNNKLQK